MQLERVCHDTLPRLISVSLDRMAKRVPSTISDRVDAIAEFVLDLAKEGERSAVVLGASRADTALDELLKRFMPQLQPALLRLSAIISQYFTRDRPDSACCFALFSRKLPHNRNPNKMKAITMRIQKSSRPGVILMATVVVIITSQRQLQG
jgi:hypothetical protein